MRIPTAALALLLLPSLAVGSVLPRSAQGWCKKMYPECSTKPMCNVARHDAMKCMCSLGGALASTCRSQGAIVDAFNDCCPSEKWSGGKTGNEDYGNPEDEGYKLCRAIYSNRCYKHLHEFGATRRPHGIPPK